MIKDITIGQYFPGESFIHKMDPRIKIILTILFIVMLFVVNSLLGFLLLGLVVVFFVLLSKISIKLILKSIKPLMFIIIFTAIFNVLYGTGAPLFPNISWLAWIRVDGVLRAVFMIIRIILLIVSTSFLTYTTSPVMLTDAIEKLLSPLTFFKIEVHDFAMMMTIALRFIPTLIDETDKIINAQKARGADFETGNIFKRAKALIPILIPLIVSAFKRAYELADAMECRCYNGGKERTKYKVYNFSYRDYIAIIFMIIVLVGVILINILV